MQRFLFLVLAGCADSYVDSVDGADGLDRARHCDASVPADYATVQAAIDAAPDGGTVCLAAGTFAGPLWVSGRTIRVVGRGSGRTIVTGDASGPTLTVGGSDLTLVGMALRGGSGCGISAEE